MNSLTKIKRFISYSCRAYLIIFSNVVQSIFISVYGKEVLKCLLFNQLIFILLAALDA